MLLLCDVCYAACDADYFSLCYATPHADPSWIRRNGVWRRRSHISTLCYAQCLHIVYSYIRFVRPAYPKAIIHNSSFVTRHPSSHPSSSLLPKNLLTPLQSHLTLLATNNANASPRYAHTTPTKTPKFTLGSLSRLYNANTSSPLAIGQAPSTPLCACSQPKRTPRSVYGARLPRLHLMGLR